ncbi:hypothetical protein GCM10023311_02520 [Flaviramulus aquimarinus]|uniref:Glycosyltransferase 2-like domain-containing protein n=1 Tax=Flaviramulus aquimarinus TaxID=1170456 RepID=A0ABP9ENY3_9FLAO
MIKKLLVYMPALNEEETIKGVLNSIPSIIDGFTSIELLVVNDGSDDKTEEEAKKAGATVITHLQNRGVGTAFQSAVDYALKTKADVMVSIDADGQFDISQIETMISPILEKKADFSIGNRFWDTKPHKMPKIKFIGNKQMSRIISFISKVKIFDASCGFRAYSRNCLLNLNLQGSFTYTHETILDLLHKGYRVSQIPVTVKYFEGRVSRVANNLFVYGFQTSKIIFKSFKDYRPLPFFLTIAFIVFMLALLMAGFVFVNWFNTGMVTPYKSLGFIALALFGMSLLISVLAFLADMLNRIRENQEKILFLTKKKYFEED